MSLIKANDLLKHAYDNNYAVGYFESWNLESTYAVIRAAESVNSPVMIGFCGEYLNNTNRKYKEDIYVYAKLIKEMAKNSSVPVVTLLNEADDLNMTYSAIKAGFDMVMYVDEEASIDELTKAQKKLVEFAKACDVAVEAEVGALGLANNKTHEIQSGQNTDPELAAKFVKDTGVDALAVAIGNIHLLEGSKASLDMKLLENLYKKINIPLVLHGGTGVDKESFKEVVKMGISKVNVGAGLKRTVINAEKKFYAENDVDTMNPNDVLGKGNATDVNMRGHDALIEEVVEYIRAFNGVNKAR